MSQNDPRSEFINAAVWHGSLEHADAILAQHPEIAGSDIHVAAILGDDAAVRRFLEADQAGRKEDRNSVGELASAAAILRHLVTNGRDGPAGPPVADAAFPLYNDSGSIRAGPARVAASGSREAGISGELRPGAKTELGHIGTAGAAEVLVSA